MRPLRVVTFNLWNDRPDMKARMRVATDGLRALQPDVIGLQEVFGTSQEDCQAAEIGRALDMHWLFDPVEQRAGGDAPTAATGNAVVSRFPIKRHETVA